MELLIVLGVCVAAIAVARWMVVRHLNRHEARERIRRRLESL